MNGIIAITGASGFIGKHLVSHLIQEGVSEIRILSRNKQRDVLNETFEQGANIFEGDLSDSGSLKGFLVPGCTVINLVYLWNAGEKLNLACIQNLLTVCKDAKVARLIHCSTAAVAGRVSNDLIDEKSQCLPVTDYGTTKLKIEFDVINFAEGNFEAVILRPTSVYGINGEPLKKLAADITSGIRWKNYLKSCLFGKRRMNLVHVANVVAAISFLIRYSKRLDGQIFIVSDDDDPKNNFIDVENFLIDALGSNRYCLPRIPVPLVVLKGLLLLLDRNNVNPHCNFDSSKLHNLGFKSPISLTEGLAEYAAWYRASHLGENRTKVS